MFGMKLPVTPMRRFEHYFTAGSPIERLPYVKDVARLAFRSEGKGFSGGLVDGNERRGFNFEVDHDYFERAVWPALAHRFPGFEAARVKTEVTAPGQGSTSRTSWTAIPSSGAGAACRISTPSPAFPGTG